MPHQTLAADAQGGVRLSGYHAHAMHPATLARPVVQAPTTLFTTSADGFTEPVVRSTSGVAR